MTIPWKRPPPTMPPEPERLAEIAKLVAEQEREMELGNVEPEADGWLTVSAKFRGGERNDDEPGSLSSIGMRGAHLVRPSDKDRKRIRRRPRKASPGSED